MRGVKPTKIGRIMTKVGATRIHTDKGNVYELTFLKDKNQLKKSEMGDDNQAVMSAWFFEGCFDELAGNMAWVLCFPQVFL